MVMNTSVEDNSLSLSHDSHTAHKLYAVCVFGFQIILNAIELFNQIIDVEVGRFFLLKAMQQNRYIQFLNLVSGPECKTKK